MDMIMRPNPANKPEELAAILEKWREQERFVRENVRGFEMGGELKINALKHIMRNFSEKFEAIESAVRNMEGDEKFNYMFNEIREFAAKRRLDEQFIKAKGDPMQIGELQNDEPQNECGEQHHEELDTTGDPWTDWCIAAMNVGKGYGKGQFPGICFKCNKPGHKAVNCQSQQASPNTNAPGKGGASSNTNRGCFTCGQTNHMQKDCPIYKKGKGKGKGKHNWNQYQNRSYGKSKGWGKGIHEMTQFLGAMNQVTPWFQGQWEPESQPDMNAVSNLGNSMDSVTRECKPSINTAPSDEWSVCVNKSRSKKDMRPAKLVKNVHKPIEPLTRDDANEVLHVEQQGEWERLRVVVDSGACETVGPANVVTSFELTPTSASTNNVHYVAANGTRIRNHGQRTIQGVNDSGNRIGFAMQAADVNKVLAAVNQIVAAGNRVTFDNGPDGTTPNNHIYNYTTGATTELNLEKGQYIFDMWVPSLSESSSSSSRATAEVATAAPVANSESTPEAPSTGFQGQEAP